MYQIDVYRCLPHPLFPDVGIGWAASGACGVGHRLTVIVLKLFFGGYFTYKIAAYRGLPHPLFSDVGIGGSALVLSGVGFWSVC